MQYLLLQLRWWYVCCSFEFRDGLRWVGLVIVAEVEVWMGGDVGIGVWWVFADVELKVAGKTLRLRTESVTIRPEINLSRRIVFSRA